MSPRWKHASIDIDRSRIALIGFSAGGHLASLLGLSNNNAVKEFYPNGVKPHFKIKTVLDFYGPSDLLMLASNPDTSINKLNATATRQDLILGISLVLLKRL